MNFGDSKSAVDLIQPLYIVIRFLASANKRFNPRMFQWYNNRRLYSARKDNIMRIRQKKREVEGWEDAQVQIGAIARLKENLRDSNRAWVVCFVGIILIGILFFIVTLQKETSREIEVIAPPHKEHGVYEDKAHNKFVRDFTGLLRKRGIAAECRFINAGRFEIIVPTVTSSDDIVFMSGASARAIERQFGNSPYVYVKTKDNHDPPRLTLVAETRWVNRRNDYDIALKRSESTDRPHE